MPALAGNIKTWDQAIEAVRGRALWFVTALAVIAVALFGATAIIVRPPLSWEQDFWRLLWAGIVGSLGVIGAVSIAWAASATYQPVEVSLEDLPAKVKKRVNANALLYLPPPIQSVDELGTTYADAFRARWKAREVLALAKERCDAAPEDAGRFITFEKAKSAFVEARARQLDLEAAVNKIIEEGRYQAVEDQRKLPGWVGLVGAAVATLGIWYQLMLASPPEDSKESTTAGGGMSIGVLVRDTTNEANTQLWTTLDLDLCVPVRPEPPDSILVLVSSGSGTREDPYKVTTLPETAVGAGCRAKSFTVFGDVAAVVTTKAEEVTITYTPATPTPSPKRT